MSSSTATRGCGSRDGRSSPPIGPEPGTGTPPKTFDEPWELYDTVTDLGQVTDLAARQPQRVAAMARLFGQQARMYHVYPQHNLSDTAREEITRRAADFARRGGVWRYSGPVRAIPQALVPPIANRTFTMTTRLDLPNAGVSGPLFAYGGQLGGMGFYLKDGRPTLILTGLDGKTEHVTASEALGTATDVALTVRKGAVGAGGADYRVTIRAGGRTLAEQSVRFAMPAFFEIGETFGVGSDEGSPVLAGYPSGMPLPAGIRDVVFDCHEPK